MNRIIKFRAWARDDNPFKKGLMSYNVYPMLNNEIYIDGDIYYVDKFIELMQFTGLHDKNGKEIYEGDIILNPLYEEPYIVEYSENLAGYVGWGDDRACGCYLITDEDIEVIGNVFENPELIK